MSERFIVHTTPRPSLELYEKAAAMPVLMNPVGYTVGCAERSVTPALGNGAMITLLQGMSGGAMSPAQLPMAFAVNTAFIYSYFVLQCPMEALHGLRSLLHNFASGGILGFLGVSSGHASIPFNLEYTFYARGISLPVGGALVYGGLATVMGAISGKGL